MPTGDPICPTCGGWLANCGGRHIITKLTCNICGSSTGCSHISMPQVVNINGTPVTAASFNFDPTQYQHPDFTKYDGLGTIEVAETMKPCDECKGTGQILLFIKSVDCDVCKGSGKVSA